MTVDIILLLILIVFVLSGYRRGMILSLCSLLILIVSCLGASVAQEVLTPRIAQQITPSVTAAISQQLETAAESSIDSAVGESGISIMGTELSGISQLLGIDLEDVVENAAENAAAPIISTAAQALAQTLVEAFSGMLVFLCAFLIIYLLLRSLELGLNTVDRLPVIHTLNHLGGGVIGFVSGAFVLVMAGALLQNTGILPENALSGPVSGLLRTVVGRILGQ